MGVSNVHGTDGATCRRPRTNKHMQSGTRRAGLPLCAHTLLLLKLSPVKDIIEESHEHKPYMPQCIG